jgi:tetratricopeptide (TPR) repeat protein
MYRSDGQFDSAATYLELYAESSPTDPTAFVTQGDLYLLLGDHDAARRAYEKALIVDMANVPALTSNARLDRDLGRFEEALDGYNEALTLAATPPQRAQAYDNLREYYLYRGQPTRSIEFLHRFWAEMEQYESPFSMLQEKLQDLDTYVLAGQVSTAKDSLSALAERLSAPFDVLVALGYMSVYMNVEDADSIEAAIPGIDRFVDAFGQEEARFLSVYAQGRVLELRGDCTEALRSYERALQLQPTQFDLHHDMGRCRRALGDLDAARSQLQRVIAIRPSDPESNYQLALVYDEMGDPDQALVHLRVALATWAYAEPQYRPARDARELLARLSGN